MKRYGTYETRTERYEMRMKHYEMRMERYGSRMGRYETRIERYGTHMKHYRTLLICPNTCPEPPPLIWFQLWAGFGQVLGRFWAYWGVFTSSVATPRPLEYAQSGTRYAQSGIRFAQVLPRFCPYWGCEKTPLWA